MKKIVLTVVLVAASLSIAFSQEYKNKVSPFLEIGLEESASPSTPGMSEIQYFYGLQYARKLKGRNFVQGNIAYSNFRNTTLGVDYQHQAPILFNGLSTFFGAGMALEFVNDPNSLKDTYTLFRPQLGLDYTLNNSFVGFFVAYKPKIDLDGFEGYDMSMVQIGINFNIR